MSLLDTILNFIKDPDNAWILYSIAAFMLVEAFLLTATSKKIAKFRNQSSESADANGIRGDLSQAVGIAAKLSAVGGLLIAGMTLYFSTFI